MSLLFQRGVALRAGHKHSLSTFISLGAFCDSPLLLSSLANQKVYYVLHELQSDANLENDARPDSELLFNRAHFELRTALPITGETKKKL